MQSIRACTLFMLLPLKTLLGDLLLRILKTTLMFCWHRHGSEIAQCGHSPFSIYLLSSCGSHHSWIRLLHRLASVSSFLELRIVSLLAIVKDRILPFQHFTRRRKSPSGYIPTANRFVSIFCWRSKKNLTIKETCEIAFKAYRFKIHIVETEISRMLIIPQIGNQTWGDIIYIIVVHSSLLILYAFIFCNLLNFCATSKI